MVGYFSVILILLISALSVQISHGAINGTEVDNVVPDAPSSPQDNAVQTKENVELKNAEHSPMNSPVAASQKDEGNAVHNETDSSSENAASSTIQGEAKNAINEFARRMSQNIFGSPSTNKTGENPRIPKTLMWSPFSVYQALVPLFYGSNGETRRELQSILLPNQNVDEKNDNDISFVTDLDKDIPRNNRGDGLRKPLSSATGLFLREDLKLNPEYISTLQKNVKNVELKSVEFSNATSAVGEINSWVQEKTKGLINEAVGEDQIDQSMFLMIVNCVRFKAPWQVQFNPNLTVVEEFHGVSGVQKVQMMRKLSNQFYGEFPRKKWYGGKGEPAAVEKDAKPFSVLEMPYKGTDLVSLFILPNSTEDLEETMNYVEAVGVTRIMGELTSVETDLSMPKFAISSEVDVVDALEKNGLRTLFSPHLANLTRIFSLDATINETHHDANGDAHAYLSRIIHRTIFETSEEGSSAGAVTALSIVPLSALGNQDTVEFELNRPFIVMLVKNETILFQGVVADLEGQNLNKVGFPDVESSTRHNLSNENETENDSADDRAWWKRKGIPEYLKLNLTANNSQESAVSPASAPVPEASTNEIHEIQAPQAVLASSPSPLPPNTFIQFTKYQQPEPRDPDGIRFPATYPLQRNKGHVRPRFDPYSQYRRNGIRSI